MLLSARDSAHRDIHMPELPEVESTVQFLRERVVGASIAHVKVLWPRTVATPAPEHFISSLSGATIQKLFRRGKLVGATVLLADSREYCLLFHMRMTGSFDVVPSSEPEAKHDRVIIAFSDGRELRFHDPRKFGRAYLVSDLNVLASTLGYEPLEPSFTPDVLQDLLARRRTALKSFLLDQRFIVGIGNIYADEVLWRAKLHPLTPCHRVPAKKSRQLYRAIVSVLRTAIAKQGTDFGDGVVDMGGYQPRVYGRAGRICPRCDTILSRIVVGQRGTHFCSTCQHR